MLGVNLTFNSFDLPCAIGVLGHGINLSLGFNSGTIFARRLCIGMCNPVGIAMSLNGII